MNARTIWISDLHLGTKLCQDEKLLKFLKSFENEDKTGYNLEKLYLNGDIIDVLQMDHKVFWGKHRTIIKKFLRMADKSVKIVAVQGNHEHNLFDEILNNDMSDINLNGISFKEQDIHIGVDGKKYLVMHGHQFDGVVRLNPILYALGDNLYKFMNIINKVQNTIRKFFGYNEWSFSLWIKTRVKEAVKFINNFEKLVVEEAKRQNVDGVINGHLHVLEDKMIDGIRYLNSGTMVEFCSYIIEHEDGAIEAKYYE